MNKTPLKTIESAEKAIGQYFARQSYPVFTRAELEAEIFSPENRRRWKLREDTPFARILGTLLQLGTLQEVRLPFPTRNYVRFIFGHPPTLEIAHSINRSGYFSHFTAMNVLGLTDQIPKTIYLNVEQRLAPGGGIRDQDAMRRTFQRPCRVTHNTTTYGKNKIAVLNGGNTGCLGVIGLQSDNPKSDLRVTGVERTLIVSVRWNPYCRAW